MLWFHADLLGADTESIKSFISKFDAAKSVFLAARQRE